MSQTAAHPFPGPFVRDKLALPEALSESVKTKNWGQVDRLCADLTRPGGAVFEKLFPLAGQKRMEYIVSVRDAENPWEEDGIWHDDGSRILAFSMGLNLDPGDIKGGELLIRAKGSQDEAHEIAPLAMGEIVVFKTGVDGYEHKVRAVSKGVRIVAAGWCYG